MPRFQIAHIKERDSSGRKAHLIIVPLETSFGLETPEEQQILISELQRRVIAAGLAGAVCPVWDTGTGLLGFIAPPKWHPYFKNLSVGIVAANVNHELYWSEDWRVKSVISSAAPPRSWRKPNLTLRVSA